MRRVLSFAALSLCLCLSSAAQKTPAAPPANPADSTAKAPDYSQEGYVVEKFRTTYRFENDGTGKRELYARIKVQSEAALEQWGQLIVGYSSANERVEIPYVRVLKADGSTVTAPADAVQDLSAPIQREAHGAGGSPRLLGAPGRCWSMTLSPMFKPRSRPATSGWSITSPSLALCSTKSWS